MIPMSAPLRSALDTNFHVTVGKLVEHAYCLQDDANGRQELGVWWCYNTQVCMCLVVRHW